MTKVNDVLSYWYDTGCFGHSLYYVRVIKIGNKKIKVRHENGGEKWYYRNNFNNEIVNEKTVTELQNDGVNI